MTQIVPEQTELNSVSDNSFTVSLDNFDGPFDLLLNLIGKHELDITEVSLSLVTDEFIRHVAALEESGVAGLNRATEFLVVAATLLDLKITRLLPQGEAVDSEEIALLEARDLLFARLLQYRAFKQAAQWLGDRFSVEGQRRPRTAPLEKKYRAAAPPLQWRTSVTDFAALALLVLTPQQIPGVGLTHLHVPAVSIREQAAYIVAIVRERGQVSFRQLIAGAESKGVVVARFLAVLELYRRSALSFEQEVPLGELNVRWSGDTTADLDFNTLGDDYDS